MEYNLFIPYILSTILGVILMDLSANIYNTLLKLCSLKSTSGTGEEAGAAQGIYSLISEIGYFKEHDRNIKLTPIRDAPHGRSYITAMYEGSPSKKVVVLLSHFDVVDVEEFGKLRKYAYSPEEYTAKLKGENLPPDVKRDLESGNWLFGRGTMDMKCGLAIHIEILRYIYENNVNLDGSILLLTVPDEENSSAGMLSAVEYLSSLKDQGYKIEGVINSEPFFMEYKGDKSRYIYTGTIGKLLPFVFCAGVEAHAGDPFSGISSSLLSSAVTFLLEDNVDLCERKGDFITPPPVCLKQEDLKSLYSVSTPDFSYSYYNYMTVKSTPEDVIEKMKGVCTKALNMALSKVECEFHRFASMTDKNDLSLNFEGHVLSYDELSQMVQKKGIDIEKIKRKYKNINMDVRETTGLIVSDMLRYLPELRPAIVIGFAPPYYPHRTAAETSKVMDICKKVMAESEKVFNDRLIHKPFFQGLCDLSYLGFENSSDYYALKCNMPVFDNGYSLPVEALSNMNIDGMNIGVIGEDAHKYTERLYMPYSFKITPDLVLFAIMEFLA
jgi:Arginine degradation protein (predicted deacylase)